MWLEVSFVLYLDNLYFFCYEFVIFIFIFYVGFVIYVLFIYLFMFVGLIVVLIELCMDKKT
jgi:hypothetical protein